MAAQWVMRGTNSGSLKGNPPTERAVSLPGADFITVENDHILSVQGYFDQTTFAKQLGLQVLVQPHNIGPVSFGNSIYLQLGNNVKPGAFSLTSISVRSVEEAQEVRGHSRQILQEMAQIPGFISALTARSGCRMFTITAWQDAENPRQLLRDGAHQEAMGQFFGPDLSAGAMTSVWVPERINAMWVRCTACNNMVDFERYEGKCQCGESLPDPPPFW